MDADTRADWCWQEGENPARPVRLPRKEEPTGFNGAHIWRELHLFALMERPTKEQRQRFIASIAARIPCGACRRNWKAHLAAHPLPHNATPNEFFEWTVERHSEVSAMIGKPRLSVAEAMAIWST